LKPGGSLVFFVGHIILDEVFNIFYRHKPDLKYWWTFSVKHSGNHIKIYPRHVFAEWKPLLWYVKGDKANDLTISNTIGDFIESTSPSKALHDWEQSPTEAEHIIKNLTIENQFVLDPMMGTGTTGLATFNLRRKFIGIEKNPETFEVASLRINKQQEFERIKEKGDTK
jgi:site-specific DNA-methyltransferase (adenine-specific)